jgi:hypothetical protein
VVDAARAYDARNVKARVGAEAVVLASKVREAPSPVIRKRTAAFADRFQPWLAHLAVEASGLWTRLYSQQDSSVVVGCDDVEARQERIALRDVLSELLDESLELISAPHRFAHHLARVLDHVLSVA